MRLFSNTAVQKQYVADTGLSMGPKKPPRNAKKVAVPIMTFGKFMNISGNGGRFVDGHHRVAGAASARCVDRDGSDRLRAGETEA